MLRSGGLWAKMFTGALAAATWCLNSSLGERGCSRGFTQHRITRPEKRKGHLETDGRPVIGHSTFRTLCLKVRDRGGFTDHYRVLCGAPLLYAMKIRIGNASSWRSAWKRLRARSRGA